MQISLLQSHFQVVCEVNLSDSDYYKASLLVLRAVTMPECQAANVGPSDSKPILLLLT